MDFSRKIAQDLLQIRAIKLSPQKPFIWASGIASPIYCDNRLLLSDPNIRQRVIAGFKSLSQNFKFDAVSGVATAGIAHGALLAHELGLPFSYVRSKAKGHGMENLIEGKLDKGANVLVIEDLISTGGSSLKAVDAIRSHGANVVSVLAIFTYGFNSSFEAFKEHRCPLMTITNFESVMEEAIKSGYIEPDEEQLLLDWRENYTKK